MFCDLFFFGISEGWRTVRVRKRSQLELAFIVFSNLGYHFSGALNDDRTLEMGGFERKEPGGGAAAGERK